MPLGFFGLGLQEIIIILAGLACLGLMGAGVVIAVILATRRSRPDDPRAEERPWNRRHNDET